MANPSENKTAVITRKGKEYVVPYQTLLWRQRKHKEKLKRQRKRRCLKLALELHSGDMTLAKKYLEQIVPQYGYSRWEMLERGKWRSVENSLRLRLKELSKANKSP